MRVLFDARRSVRRTTGIGRIIDGLLPALAREDSRNQYLVLIGEKNPLAEVRADNFEVRAIDLPINSLLINTTMPALARSWRADVAYFPFWLAPVAMPCRTVVAIHDLIQIFHPEGFSLAHRAAFRVYGRLVARRSWRVHALATHGKEALQRLFGIRPDRVDVVSPAAALDRDGDEPQEGAPVTIFGERPFALYVGNHKPHKNLERLLRAFARVADRIESSLVVVGTKSSTKDPWSLPHVKLVTQLALTGRVHFAGDVDDATLARLYRSARFFVYPSLYEGFGLPPLEAMAHGTPVICSNTTSLPEVVGDAALMFDPCDEDAIASALLRVDGSQGLRDDLTRRGRIQAKHFSWNKSALAWLASLSVGPVR